MNTIEKEIKEFREHLTNLEKADATISKYIHDVTVFAEFLGESVLTKSSVLHYKSQILTTLSPASVNSAISSLNSFFDFYDRSDCKVKTIKLPKHIFSDKELTRDEYFRLINVAKKKGDDRLRLLMQAICSTGIRISELKFITVEALEHKEALINCKGKMRIVLLPEKLCMILHNYALNNNIHSGSIFVTRNGNPVDRSNTWSQMKKICIEAKVATEKIYPHNLRHLFARTYYSVEKDIVRLADILGHTSIDTTRVYTIESGAVHREQIQGLNLLEG